METVASENETVMGSRSSTTTAASILAECVSKSVLRMEFLVSAHTR